MYLSAQIGVSSLNEQVFFLEKVMTKLNYRFLNLNPPLLCLHIFASVFVLTGDLTPGISLKTLVQRLSTTAVRT